jgi:argininosuccinate synthase
LVAALAAQHAETLAADTVVHGFSGNDALRIATALRVLAPALRIRTVRDVCGDAIVRPAGEYTVSSNLWGHSTEGGVLDDPSTRAPAELWSRSYPNQSELAQLEFERGVPIALDGTRMRLADIVGRLTSLGERFGAGRFDVVENGQVGLKTRAIYDAPAAAALVTAHEDLERLVCSRREHRFKRLADAEWAELVYDGLWFDPARESLDRLIDGINERVTGRVTLELNPGAVRVVARDSQFAIYDEQRAVHRAGPLFGQHLIDELATQQSLASCLSRASVTKGNQCFA